MKLKREADDNWDERVRRTIRRQDRLAVLLGIGLGCTVTGAILALVWSMGKWGF